MSRDRAIFFDVDDTLIRTKSMFGFQAHYFAYSPEYQGQDADALMASFRDALAARVPTGRREDLNREFYKSFAGREVRTVADLAKDWFAALLKSGGVGLYVPSALCLLEEYRKRDYRIVGVSGSSHEILAPVKSALDFDDLLAARLEVADGFFTGQLLEPQTIGQGKAEAIRAYADLHKLNLARCAACGDHLSDADMLGLVGESFVVPGDSALMELAAVKAWQILDGSAAQGSQEMHV